MDIFAWEKFIIKLANITFNESSRSSQHFIIKQINWKQTSLLLAKEEYLFYCKLDFYFDGRYFNDLTLSFSFWIYAVSSSRKILPLQPYGHKYFSVKPQTHAFSQSLTEYRSSFQPLPALQNLETLYMTPNKTTLVGEKDENFCFSKILPKI